MNTTAFLLSTILFLSACGQGLRANQPTTADNGSLGSEVGGELGDEPVDPPGDIKDAPVPTLGNPVTDKNFLTLPNGKSLTTVVVSGVKLSLSRGTGTAFSAAKKAEYEALKKATQSDPAHKVQWVFADLDAHTVIAKSLSSNKKLFGASSSKIFVAGGLLDKQKGTLSAAQLQLMADMLVVSSNTAWTNLQTQIGDGSSDNGRKYIDGFTHRLGLPLTRGYQGYWGSVHGNELVPDETIEYLHDVYTLAFPGAETLWKFMHTCRTGASRGRKYIPSTVYVGGKTGTYDGPTENPETGKSYDVKIRNHILVFNIDGHQYGLVVLANSGSDESAALMAGGLIREYTSVK